MSALNMTILRTLLAAALGAAAGFAQAQNIDLNRLFSIGRDAVTAVAGVSEQDEQIMGREIAGRMLGAAPLVNDAALQAYVNRVGRWIALQSERPDLPWRFAVIDTASMVSARTSSASSRSSPILNARMSAGAATLSRTGVCCGMIRNSFSDGGGFKAVG